MITTDTAPYLPTEAEMFGICQQAVTDWTSDSDDGTGTCLPWTLALQRRFVGLGAEAHLAYGTFELDMPDPQMDDEEVEVYQAPHYWLVVVGCRGPLIVDITASQFADECDEPKPQQITLTLVASNAANRYTLQQLDPPVDLHQDDRQWLDRVAAGLTGDQLHA